MKKKISFRTFTVMAMFVFAFFTGQESAKKSEGSASSSASGANLVFILDASGSMWGQVEGKAKIVIAKETLTSLIRDLPDDTRVGLVAYGHRSKGDCNDVEELFPLGPLDKEKLIEKIQAINPKGKTPITLSVRMTAEKLKTVEGETTIILVSDGKETCEGDPCAMVKELKELGIKFVMNVIGFDVTEEERIQLECMAKAGGGRYFTAKTVGEFMMAAKEVVEDSQNFGILKITAIKNGKLFDAKVYYYRGGEKESFFNKTTHPESGEARLRVIPGIYDIKVVDYHTGGEPAVTIERIEVPQGETVERTADFSNGILKVTSYMNGEPIGCPVDIYKPDGKKLLNTWTQRGSRVIELLPGTYDVKVTKVDIPGGNPVVWFRGVEIEPEQTMEKKADFPIGFLKVTATLDGKPFNTPAQLYKSGTTNNIGHWTSDNGSRTFPLVPGLYDVKVVSIKDNKQFKEFKGIKIEAGKTEAIEVAFPVESVQTQDIGPSRKAAEPATSKPPEKQPDKAASKISAKAPEKPASAQEPEEIFGGKVPIYEGARVKKTSTVGNMEVVEMEADASPGEILDFYKSEMKKRGWNIITAVARGNTASAALSKGQNQLIIGAQQRGSKTVISLSLREM